MRLKKTLIRTLRKDGCSTRVEDALRSRDHARRKLSPAGGEQGQHLPMTPTQNQDPCPMSRASQSQWELSIIPARQKGIWKGSATQVCFLH